MQAPIDDKLLVELYESNLQHATSLEEFKKRGRQLRSIQAAAELRSQGYAVGVWNMGTYKT